MEISARSEGGLAQRGARLILDVTFFGELAASSRQAEREKGEPAVTNHREPATPRA